MIFQANDGSRFDTEAETRKYEKMVSDLDVLLGTLPNRDDALVGFSSGKGFIQHEKEALAKFDAAFAEIMERNFSKETVDCYRKHPHGIVWRILDGNDPFTNAICKAGYRRLCIDENLREWGQPYFAMTYAAHETQEICLNPK